MSTKMKSKKQAHCVIEDETIVKAEEVSNTLGITNRVIELTLKLFQETSNLIMKKQDNF